MTLERFFSENARVAIAFSGGVDSSYLLYEAARSGAAVKAYYVKTEFQPAFELEDARRLAEELMVDMRVLSLSALEDEEVAKNPPDRCYYCKRRIFGSIAKAAAEDGCEVLCDGTNASDDAGERPGMRALKELRVLSPLRICGLGKEEIRRRSKEAGLFNWDKPAYACLATRIQSLERITREKLEAAEAAEGLLFAAGFRDFRVRQASGHARIQLREEQVPLLWERREELLEGLRPLYRSVSQDLEARR